MRADRLLKLLMLLQSQGRMNAGQLARELEVSQRTIYRDVEALSTAGVPIYGQPGPDGGFALVESYRTTLTGLTEGEMRALFLLTLPTPLTDLGIGEELKGALLKLSAALSAAGNEDQARLRQHLHVDPTWWHQGTEPIPHLQTVHRAVSGQRRLLISYRPSFTPVIERLVSPYGLVAKAGVWHLVYAIGSRIHVIRIADLLTARLDYDSFVRPGDFDLVVFWNAWCARRESYQATFQATVRIAPDFVDQLPRYFGQDVEAQIAGATRDGEGWITLPLRFASLAAARERLLGFGRAVEVIEPLPLRRSLLDFAEQIVALYTG